MKLSKIALGSTLAALLVLMVPLAFANGNGDGEPGYSPGYWKHQLKVMFNGRGHMQETVADMEDYAAYIDDLDTDIEMLNGVPGFDLEDAFLAFTDTSYNHMWTTIANWFNEAAGLEPYVDTD